MIGPTDLERKSMFNKIKEIFSVPIIFFNGLGCIIAAIWLGILGEWTLLGFGILLSVLLTYLLTMLILPNLVIGGISLHFYNKGKMFLRYLFAYISIFYVNILIICTCICAFIFCAEFYRGDAIIGAIPYLLWSWGLALGPWHFFALKRPWNDFAAITLLRISIFYFLFLLSTMFIPTFSLLLGVIFGLVELIILPISSMYLAYRSENLQRFSQMA
jgi:hypothetical protein